MLPSLAKAELLIDSCCPHSGSRKRSVLFAGLTLLTAVSAVAAEKIDFNRDIQPILSADCFECHGPDASHRKAKLRLDRREDAMADRDGSRVIVPGNLKESELIYRITTDDEDDRMPPKKKNHRLTSEQIGLFQQWIAEGAEYTEHWAFLPPKKAPLPEVHDPAWNNSPIDRFVLSRLQKEQLHPAGKASRETLIRRATLDLTGLPPTPEEIDAFLADESPQAYTKLVDRLLTSPHYGERWGRHWLDVARYADSGGFETDLFFGHAWRYRDYVIRSLNADKPFDQFVREQIAGDELYPGNKEALLATGFYTTGPVLQESGMVPNKLEYDQLTDAADTTGSAFLGLTVGCARCHDHKYDPISQKDYYGLQAIFAASDQSDFTTDGTKLRDRAALKSTQKEFEGEQAKMRTRRETDPVRRTEDLRAIGDSYIAADKDLTERVDATQRYKAIHQAVERYQEALTGKKVTDRGEQEHNPAEDDNDNDNVAVAAALASVANTKTSDQLEGLLVDVGRVAIQNGEKGNPDRRAFRQLTSDDEKHHFLLEYGKRQLDLQKPSGYIDDLEAFRLELGQKHLNDDTAIPVRVLAHREQPFETHVLKRGEIEMPGDLAVPGIPSKLAGNYQYGNPTPDQRRAALARWVASPENPLTARVIVNRVWQWHFGQGIVRTPNDFGIRGERASHPELLDWLTVDFVQHGWQLKRLHRLIMLSNTYQMASTADADTLERDPENRLLTRYQPHRLEAEAIWDSLRAVAGTLDLTMFGLPFAPRLDGQEQIGNFRKWPTSAPEDSNRRAIYLLVKRSFRFPTLSAFDLPDNVTSCGRRDITTIPNQALTLLNSRMTKELSEAFADRLLRECSQDLQTLPVKAWKYAYGRTISDEERQQVSAFLEARKEENGGDANAIKPAVSELCMALLNTNEFIYQQ